MKTKLLNALIADHQSWQSGEKLAQGLGVSRASIWKYIEQLRSEGIDIQAFSKKGYRLGSTHKILSEDSIHYFLSSDHPFKITFLDTIDSTNEYAKQLAQNKASAWTVVVANQQTAGKGRCGRSFYSPGNDGIYLSVVLRPNILAEKATLLTIAAATSVALSCEEISNKDCQIKWVNDIYLNGKKISGILTEASLSIEAGVLQWAVIGIGINLWQSENWPSDIANVAGSLFMQDEMPAFARTRLVAAVLNRLYTYAESLLYRSYLKDYRDRFYLINQNAYLVQGTSSRAIVPKGIDEDGRLIAINEHGEIEHVFTGEISLRENK